MRKLKVIGTGEHHLTKVVDAETGEDIGRMLGASRVSVVIGADGYPKPKLVLEITEPFEIDLRSSPADQRLAS